MAKPPDCSSGCLATHSITLAWSQAFLTVEALAFCSVSEGTTGRFSVIYAPVFLKDLARGYCCLLAVPNEGWDAQQFALFSSLLRFASRSLTAFQDLQRAQEDREVLHLNLVGIAPEMQRAALSARRRPGVCRWSVPAPSCAPS